jgi:peptidyl-tRNA hydrolase, PTH1 family
MQVVVGLGNPGPQYRDTRHNVGFMVLDRVAERLGASFDREKYAALIAQARHGAETLLLMKPLTYMNRSGDSVAAAVRNLPGREAALLVVTDDVNLPFGTLRFRQGGSAGGHNGLANIIERVGSDGFSRLRIGVGENKAHGDLTGHVLGKFRPAERTPLSETLERAADGVLCCVEAGIAAAMNEFNRRPVSGETDEETHD